jgi:hypothetical protein
MAILSPPFENSTQVKFLAYISLPARFLFSNPSGYRLIKINLSEKAIPKCNPEG